MALRASPVVGQRLKVLALIDSLGGGGTERSLVELVGPLANLTVEVAVVVLDEGRGDGLEDLLLQQGGECVCLASDRRKVMALRRLLLERRPDVLHTMLYRANQVGRVAAIGTKVPVMTSLVNTSYSPERYRAGGISRSKHRLVQAVDVITSRLLVAHFHAVSETVEADAVSHLHIPQSRITVVPRGRADPRSELAPTARSRVRHELGIPPDADVVVSVGRQEWQKDHLTVIRAMAALLESRRDLWLIIAGRTGAASAALQAELSTHPEAHRVRLLGHRDDVPELLEASDLFVLASRHEGMPGAVIEAMAMGLPVVASAIGPVHEVVEPERSAIVVTPGDIRAFASAIELVLDEPSRRMALGHRGREVFERRFRIEQSAAGMADLYSRVAHERTSRRLAG